MTPKALYSKLQDLHSALTAIHGNPQAVAANWTTIAGDLNELAKAVKKTVSEETCRFFWLFCGHAYQALEGGVAALQLVCNSDDDKETADVILLVDSALSGLCHTLQRYFLVEDSAND